jgi:hypothetical protein
VHALALVAKHPEEVRKLVAHEPPLASVLPDAENAKAAVRAISDSYQRGGFGAGMAHFMAIENGRLVGMVAQADIALKENERTGELVGAISEPSEGERR